MSQLLLPDLMHPSVVKKHLIGRTKHQLVLQPQIVRFTQTSQHPNLHLRLLRNQVRRLDLPRLPTNQLLLQRRHLQRLVPRYLLPSHPVLSRPLQPQQSVI